MDFFAKNRFFDQKMESHTCGKIEFFNNLLTISQQSSNNPSTILRPKNMTLGIAFVLQLPNYNNPCIIADQFEI